MKYHPSTKDTLTWRSLILVLNIFKKNFLSYIFVATWWSLFLLLKPVQHILHIHARFFIKNTFISKTRLKLVKNQANTKQHPEAELLLFRIVHIIIRSSRLGVFSEKGVLRNFTKFTGKHVCQSLFFNKVSDLCQSLFFNSFMTEAVII